MSTQQFRTWFRTKNHLPPAVVRPSVVEEEVSVYAARSAARGAVAARSKAAKAADVPDNEEEEKEKDGGDEEGGAKTAAESAARESSSSSSDGGGTPPPVPHLEGEGEIGTAPALKAGGDVVFVPSTSPSFPSSAARDCDDDDDDQNENEDKTAEEIGEGGNGPSEAGKAAPADRAMIVGTLEVLAAAASDDEDEEDEEEDAMNCDASTSRRANSAVEERSGGTTTLDEGAKIKNKRRRRKSHRPLFEFRSPAVDEEYERMEMLYAMAGVERRRTFVDDDDAYLGGGMMFRRHSKRKLKSISRFDPEPTSMRRSSGGGRGGAKKRHGTIDDDDDGGGGGGGRGGGCRAGEGFQCPRCDGACSYDARRCTYCGLECCYEAGVGAVTLVERGERNYSEINSGRRAYRKNGGGVGRASTSTTTTVKATVKAGGTRADRGGETVEVVGMPAKRRGRPPKARAVTVAAMPRIDSAITGVGSTINALASYPKGPSAVNATDEKMPSVPGKRRGRPPGTKSAPATGDEDNYAMSAPKATSAIEATDDGEKMSSMSQKRRGGPPKAKTAPATTFPYENFAISREGMTLEAFEEEMTFQSTQTFVEKPAAEDVESNDIVSLNAHATVNAALDAMFKASSALFDDEEVPEEIPGGCPPSSSKRQWRAGADKNISSFSNDDVSRQLLDLQSEYAALLRKSSIAERAKKALASKSSELESALRDMKSVADRANATIFSLKSRNSSLQSDFDSVSVERDSLAAKLAMDSDMHDNGNTSLPEDVSNCSTSETNIEDMLRSKLEESLNEAQSQKDDFLLKLEEVESDTRRREEMFKKERGEWEERERAARDEAVTLRKRILHLESMCEVVAGQRDRASKRVRELLLSCGGGGGLIGLAVAGDDRVCSSRVGRDSSDDTSDAEDEDEDGRGAKHGRHLNGGNKHRVKKVLDSFKSEIDALATGLIESKSMVATLKAERDVAIEQSSRCQVSVEALREQVDSLQCQNNKLYQRILREAFFRSDHNEALQELVNVNFEQEENYDHFFSSSGSVGGDSFGSMNDENSVSTLHPQSQIQPGCTTASMTTSSRSKHSTSGINIPSLADAQAEEEENMLEDLSHALDSMNDFDLLMDLGLEDDHQA